MSDILSLLMLLIVVLPCLSLLILHCVTGVPAMPSTASEATAVVALLKQAGLPKHAIVYDLGSGWGSLVIALARAFPDAQIRGIEVSPLPYWLARLRTRKMPNVFLQWGDFYKSDLQDAHAVTCYLMIKPMRKLELLLDDMLKPGTPVVSLTFWFRDREVSAVRQGLGLGSAAALYIWPARKVTAP
jgi:hypothetical protein